MSKRSSSDEHEASRRMKTEFLIQMDGLVQSDSLVFVLAASNFPFDLDPALLRRLEKRILVPLPEEESRKNMFASLLTKDIAQPVLEESFSEFAKKTKGYSGSDIRLVCKEAAMQPLRRLMSKLQEEYGDDYLDFDDVKSIHVYANMLYNGDGIEINKREAAQYFKIAADKGNSNFMYKYAVMLYEGDGIEINKRKAAEYFKMASNKGHIKSIIIFARMLSEGNIVLKNKEEAARLYKVAADKGNVESMREYANMLYIGDGIEMNKKEATRYYKLAADKNDPESMIKYAKILLEYNIIP